MNGASTPHRFARRALLLVNRTITHVRLRRATSFGRNPRLAGAPHIENWGTLEIGDGFTLSSAPVRSHLVVRPDGAIAIGDNVTIGSGAAIASEHRIEIGDGVSIGSNVMIMDTDFHDVRQFDQRGSAAPVVIEAGARIGSNVTILKGTCVLAGVRVADGSVVSGTLRTPPPKRDPQTACGVKASSKSTAREILTQVTDVVASTFDTAGVPRSDDGPLRIAGWDSLGSLRLLLAIEEEFGIALPDGAMCEVSSVADLANAVTAQLAR